MDQLGKLVERLEKVTKKLEGIEVGSAVVSGGPGGSAPEPRVSVSTGAAPNRDPVTSFQKLLNDHLGIVEDATSKIGKQGVIWAPELQQGVVDATGILLKALQAEKTIVEAMSQCRAPSQPELQKLVQPVVDLMGQAAAKTEGRRTDIFNHVSMIAEAMNALSWVVVSGEGADKPPMHVTQCWQSAEFYANKILKEFRVSDTTHVKWVNAVKGVIMALCPYTKEFHLGKPQWKEGGISVSEFLGADPPVEAAPPPAPEPVKKETPKASKPEFPPSQSQGLPQVHPTKSWQPVESQKSSELVEGVFNNVKQGLKKVTDSDKSKNQPSRSGLVPAKLKPLDGSQTKEGKTELVMERKWSIENHKGIKDIEIEVNSRQSVYIYKCDDCVIKVNGKVNAITVDFCKRTGVLFESATAAVEIVNSSKVDLQCTTKVGTLAIDKSDECQVYIPEDSMDLEITSAKSSNINVAITGEKDYDDSRIPDQFISKFVDGVLVTKPSEHAGA